MKRKTWITLIQLVFFAAVSIFILWYLLYYKMNDLQRTQMVDAVLSANLALLPPVAIAAFLSHWARAKRWQLLLRPMGLNPSTTNTVLAVLIGYLINLVPPRAGEVAKCTILARYEDLPADKMIGSIVAERAWDVVCLFVLIAGGLGWQAAVMNPDLKENLIRHAPSYTKIFIILAAGFALMLALYLWYRYSKASKIRSFILGLGKGLASILHLRQRGLFLIYTVLIWGMYLIQIIIGFWAMTPTAHLGVGAGLMALIFGAVGMVAMPNGLGLYPYLVGLVLFQGYGISEINAQGYGWMSWSIQIGVIVIYGIASLIILPLYNRKRNAKNRLDKQQNIYS